MVEPTDFSPPDRERDLLPLLDHLATAAPAAATRWQHWRITPVTGGANNLLYRATGDAGDLAVKFTIRDARDRAGREYHALLALREAGLDIAPRPVLLERDRYPQPVVVQTWLAGVVAGAPPATDDDWRALVQHYVALQALTPDRVARPFPDAVLTMRSARDGRACIGEQLARLPAEARPATLRALVVEVERLSFPTWPPPRLALCRCDPNTTNFIRRPARWASVDWENAGWGDPAHELVDLMVHPAYLAVPPARWAWVVETYRIARDDATFATRLRTYRLLCLVWWVARFARSLYEVPRGLDRRLAARPADWQAATQAKYDHYLERATAALREGLA